MPMHSPKGLVLTLLVLAAALLSVAPPAAGQVTGQVETIGFDTRYRPDGWTPMLVILNSQLDRPQEYQLQVHQEDLDRDRVLYTRQVTLNARQQERFWVYFLPKPVDGGLPDALGGTRNTPADLEKAVSVWVCTKGGERITKLPLNNRLTVINVDPRLGPFDAGRGRRVVLYVIEAGGTAESTPAFAGFERAIGMREQPVFIPVTVRDLPENVIGYEAVDAIVWLNADAGQLAEGGSRRQVALEQWVRQGGRLVISQPPLADRTAALAELSPVDVKEIRDRADLQPLIQLARYRTTSFSGVENAAAFERMVEDQGPQWQTIEQKGPFRFGYAAPKPGAVVERWMDWTEKPGEDRSPYLARRPYGLGAVTWVAHDLGNPTLTGRGSSGWPYVWDSVLGLRNLGMRVEEEQTELLRERFGADVMADLGGSLLQGMEHEGRAGSYIALAVLFFIAYWVFAGPGSYLFLANKGMRELSWMIFAVSALGATLVTVAVVRLVLRGRPEAHHVSVVRAVPGTAADGTARLDVVINSRVGLYIPASTRQRVAMTGADPQAASYLTPFAIHPVHLGDSEAGFSDKAEYTLPVRDDTGGKVEVEFPYRSTLKKLEAQWVGQLAGGIAGAAILADPSVEVTVDGKLVKVLIDGSLTNNTGVDFQHVYFAFSHPVPLGTFPDPDYLLYVPEWKNGQPLFLAKEFAAAPDIRTPESGGAMVVATPGENKPVKGMISHPIFVNTWDRYWFERVGRRFQENLYKDDGEAVRHSFPMLSLFDRIIPVAKRGQQLGGNERRVELLRRNAREWDVSEQLAAGQLVILAQSGGGAGQAGESPLPFPLEVEGDRVQGSGTTFYQIALPLHDPKNLRAPPATQPSSDENATPPAAAAPGAGSVRSLTPGDPDWERLLRQ